MAEEKNKPTLAELIASAKEKHGDIQVLKILEQKLEGKQKAQPK